MAEQRDTGGVEIIELFTDSVDVFREHAMQFVIATTIVLVLSSATSYFFLAGLLLLGPMVMGIFKMSLCAVRKEEVRLGDALSGFDYFVSAVLLNITVVAFTIMGFFLCVFPALFAFSLFLPSYFFLLDGSNGLSEALAMNRAMLKADLRSWLIVSLYFLALVFVGAALFGLGLIVTLPIGIISLARLYDRYKSGLSLSGMPLTEDYS